MYVQPKKYLHVWDDPSYICARDDDLLFRSFCFIHPKNSIRTLREGEMKLNDGKLCTHV